MHWAGPDSRSGATNWNEAFRFRSRRQQRIFSRTSVCFRLIWSFNSDPLLLFLVFHSLLLLKAVPLVLCALRFFFVCMVPPPPERKRRFSDVCPFFFPFTQLFSRFFYLPGRGICFPSTLLFFPSIFIICTQEAVSSSWFTCVLHGQGWPCFAMLNMSNVGIKKNVQLSAHIGQG